MTICDALTCKRSFESMMIQAQKKPLYLLLDRGRRFANPEFQSWAVDLGIRLELCSPHAQQCGVVERVIGTLKRKTIVLLNAAHMNQNSFSYALEHSCNIYNNTYHSSIKISPLDAWKGSGSRKSLKAFRNSEAVAFYEDGKGFHVRKCHEFTPRTIKILSEADRTDFKKQIN